MKKQILTLMVAAISITGFAQVGVGTADPQKALHIVGNGVRIENAAETSHYDLPDADGTAGQVLTTNGASAVTWTAVSSGNTVSSIIANTPTPTYNGETVILDNNTGTHTITLPNPANYADRIIYIRNNSAAAGGAGNGTYLTYVPVNTPTIFANRGHVLFSDGTNWFMVGGL